MVSYIQYKRFDSIEELNEWLKDFRALVTDDEKNTPFIYMDENTTSCRTLMNVQFLPEASINSNSDTINGASRIYPIAQYKVTILGK